MGKQPAGKLRQAFDMCKNRITLTQAQFSLFHRQKPGAILSPITVKESNGCGVIAGINSDNTHSFASAAV
jgi:hypothetical protein